VVLGMIKTQTIKKTGETKVTFILNLDDDRLPASVVGDFNGWNPMAHPLRKRSNGTASVAVIVPAGSQYEFRYLGANDNWFDEDPDGDRVVRIPGQPNGLLRG
jgi:1,4-alpha-glucan branching enzyme